MNRKQDKTYDFAFLVHPRGLQDIHLKYPFTQHVPKKILTTTFQYAQPLVVGTITGVPSSKGAPRRGVLISLPLTAEQMLKNRPLAKRHVIKAIKKARTVGAKHVGLGAFTSVVTEGGAHVRDLYDDVHITNGNALTAYMTFKDVVRIAETWKDDKPTIAVVGASGSVGAVVTELLTKHEHFKRLYAVGRTRTKIEMLIAKLQMYSHGSFIQNATLEEALPEADIVISATSAHGAVVTPSLIKESAIIYDITQPKNIHEELMEERSDVTIYDGGLVQFPETIHISQDMGLPQQTTFSCLAETMLLSADSYADNFCIGKATVDQVNHIASIAERFAFLPSNLRRWENKL